MSKTVEQVDVVCSECGVVREVTDTGWFCSTLRERATKVRAGHIGSCSVSAEDVTIEPV